MQSYSQPTLKTSTHIDRKDHDHLNCFGGSIAIQSICRRLWPHRYLNGGLVPLSRPCRNVTAKPNLIKYVYTVIVKMEYPQTLNYVLSIFVVLFLIGWKTTTTAQQKRINEKEEKQTAFCRLRTQSEIDLYCQVVIMCIN